MKQNTLHTLTLCATLALLVAIAATGESTVPQLINYQGYLTSAQGDPLETAEYDLSFSIYDQQSDGTEVWGPQVMSKVPVVKGHFNVILGPTDSASTPRDISSAFTESVRFLEIKVAGTPIAPRQQILSAPYAMHSAFDVPVGAIIPWIPPVSSRSAEEQLPQGFKLCSGPAATDDPSTPFDERRIPNLTDERFLMGGTESNINTTGGTNTIANAGAHSHTGTTGSGDGGALRAEGGASSWVSENSHTHKFSTDTVSAHTHGENRPKYVSVIMIIRVY